MFCNIGFVPRERSIFKIINDKLSEIEYINKHTGCREFERSNDVAMLDVFNKRV